MVARLLLLSVLALTLTSCASLGKPQVVFAPPKIDCGAFEPPKVQTPTEPRLGEKDVIIWQLYAYKWQAVTEHILGQRLDTAKCMAALREAGIVK